MSEEIISPMEHLQAEIIALQARLEAAEAKLELWREASKEFSKFWIITDLPEWERLKSAGEIK